SIRRDCRGGNVPNVGRGALPLSHLELQSVAGLLQDAERRAVPKSKSSRREDHSDVSRVLRGRKDLFIGEATEDRPPRHVPRRDQAAVVRDLARLPRRLEERAPRPSRDTELTSDDDGSWR